MDTPAPPSDIVRSAALEAIRSGLEGVAGTGFDHHVWGVGEADTDGSMQIDVELSDCSLGKPFLEGYNGEIRQVDLVGRIHVALPGLLQVWKASDLAKSYAARTVKSYLAEGRLLSHVMLCGIHSSYGRAWITFYRTDKGPKSAFTRHEAEYARYKVPYELFAWQKSLMPQQLSRLRVKRDAAAGRSPEPSTMSSVLSPRDVAIVLAHATQVDKERVVALVGRQFPKAASNTNPAEAISRAYLRTLKRLGMTPGDLQLLLMQLRKD